IRKEFDKIQNLFYNREIKALAGLKGVVRQKDSLLQAHAQQVHAEAEISKRQKEYLRNLDKEIARLKGEKAEIHKGYKAEIAKLEKEYETENDRPQEEIKGLQLEATHFKTETVRLSEDMTRVKQGKKALEGKIAYQWERLHEIETSLVWHLINRYRRLVERWLPQNTRRRRFYRLCVLAPVVLFREGHLAFCKKIAARLPGVEKLGKGMDSEGQSGKTWHALSFPNFDEKDVSIIIPVYNQCEHTFRCLESILKNSTVPYEVILVDNASDKSTAQMLDAMEGIRVIHNKENQGFVIACNEGAKAGEGKNYLFLNNDTEVTQGWLEAMLSPLEDRKAGIVGAKLVYPDGRLQEAGNIIWQDGTGWNYGRGDGPDLPQYSYLKEVDYCSGACLLVKKELWKKLGGFDQRYIPAYYEDTDLCFAARQKGYKVIYQPEARVIHWEGLSAGTDIDKGYKRYQQTNLNKFREKWQEVLCKDHFKGPDDLYPARERGFEKRVLVVDHYVPTFDMDSGSLRMFSLIKIFMELGYKVIFWPENRAYHERYTRELQRIGVEVLYGEIDFEEYLKNYGQYINLIFLSRPHIAVHFIYASRTLTKARIIYDTVDLNFVREERKAMIEAKESSLYWKDMELFLAHQADETLVVSPVEKEILEKEGLEGKVSVITNIHTPESFHKPFDQRKGLMFIGGFLHLPNEDGIVWFVESVLPLIERKLSLVPLCIVGSHPTESVKLLASPDVIVTGYVKDVCPYFEKARVFVCPLRYGAGIKGKIGQSMAYGLPVVTTSIGAEGMGLTDGHNALIADDEEMFAQKVIKVYQDRKLWETLSLNAMALIEKNYSPAAVKQALRMLLNT
ncbi:MAG: glycosyltransferase, partial [Deltaproteobacteria bacterium]|nr:glycosyltransferase [Deltaproteobacteria bacterium]